MKKLFFLLLFLCGGVPGVVHAQNDCSLPPVFHTLHANRFRVSMHPSGLGALNGHTTMMDFDGKPKLNAGIEGMSVWIGGVDPGGSLRMAAETFTPNLFSLATSLYNPGPLNADGTFNPAACANWNRIWSVKGYQIEQHLLDIADNGQLDHPIPEVLAWPARGNPYFESINGFELPDHITLATFYDADLDGVYDPYEGDVPIQSVNSLPSIPSEMTYSIANTSNFWGSQFDINTMSWAYACEENNLLNDVWFQEIIITSRSDEALDSVHVGFWFNTRLGDLADDYFGTDSSSATFFVYNADDTDGNPATNSLGFGKHPPVVSVTILDNGKYWPLKSMYYNRPADNINPATTEPMAPNEYYNYITGSWRDGTPLTYGGTGYNPNDPLAQEAYVAFNGTPSDPSGWSMDNLNVPPYGDQRALLIAKPQLFQPNGRFKFTLAYAFHRDTNLAPAQQVDYMLHRVDTIRELVPSFDQIPCSRPNPCVGLDCVWPGDTDQNGRVEAQDVLGVGFAYTTNGPVRSGFVNWEAHNAADWPTVFNQNTNYKHIDANGNGQIEAFDLEVIQEFYGKTTPWWQPQPDEALQDSTLKWKVMIVQAPLDSFLPNKWLLFRFFTDQVAGLAGLSYTVEIDTQYWKTTQVSIMGSSNDQALIFAGQDGLLLEGARVERQPGELVSNVGLADGLLIAKSIAPNLPDTTFIRVKNVHGITTDGHIVRLGGASLPVRFARPTIATTEPQYAPVVVYPNPATEVVHIVAPGTSIRSVHVLRSTGTLVSAYQPLLPVEALDLQVAQLPSGLYFLRIETEVGVTTHKCVIE
jgi:hypothetical protein